MPDDTAGLWQTVRRALGRLAGTTKVRELSLADLAPAPAVAAPPSLTAFAVGRGAAESLWTPAAQAAQVPLPQAVAGSGKADLSPAVTLARLDAVLSAGSAFGHYGGPAADGLHHAPAEFDRPAGTDAGGRVAAVTFLAGPLIGAAVRFAPPDTARLTVEAPSLARGPILRLPGRRAASDDLLRLAGGHVRPGTGMLAQIPMKRVGRPVPKGVSVADAFAAEWQLLAQKAEAAPSDVFLVGVFPQVPVAAVRRLALEEGALCLWLKPEALAAAATGKVPRLATLIIGRQRSTGKMIQTVV